MLTTSPLFLLLRKALTIGILSIYKTRFVQAMREFSLKYLPLETLLAHFPSFDLQTIESLAISPFQRLLQQTNIAWGSSHTPTSTENPFGTISPHQTTSLINRPPQIWQI